MANGSPDSAADAIALPVTTPLSLDEVILEEVIDIDLSTKDLQLFFGFMQVTARFKFLIRPHSFDIDIDQARFLLSLINQYECDTIRSALYEHLALIAWDCPWEVLLIACQEDQLDLGRTALSYLWPERLCDFIGSDRSTEGWMGLSKLSDVWQAEFWRIVMPGSKRQDTILLMELDPENHDWSRKFNPDGYQEESDVNGKRKRV